MSRSPVHMRLGMLISCLTRPFSAPLTVYFVLVRAQNLHARHPSTQFSHNKHSNLNSYGNINPKPVNQRPRDALDFPETSPFKRILQGAAKGLTSSSDHPYYFSTKIPPTSAVFPQFIVANKFIAHCCVQIERLRRERASPVFHSWTYPPPPCWKLERFSAWQFKAAATLQQI